MALEDNAPGITFWGPKLSSNQITYTWYSLTIVGQKSGTAKYYLLAPFMERSFNELCCSLFINVK